MLEKIKRNKWWLLGGWFAAVVLLAMAAGFVSMVADAAKPRVSEAMEYQECFDRQGMSAWRSCQREVWGENFGESDKRWLCDVMGQGDCSLATQIRCPGEIETFQDPSLGTVVRCFDPRISH